MDTKKLTAPLAALAIVISAGGGIVTAAHADTSTTSSSVQTADTQDGAERVKPAAMGKVTAIDGSTISLEDRDGKLYTVDASDATIQEHTAPTTQGAAPATPTQISISDIAVDDMIMVQGTVDGSTIDATKIDVGDMRMGGPGMGHGNHRVHGTVTGISGSTITVKDQDGTTYTVNAADATVTQMQTVSLSDITIGDQIGADGTVDGTSVTATHIMSGMPERPDGATK